MLALTIKLDEVKGVRDGIVRRCWILKLISKDDKLFLKHACLPGWGQVSRVSNTRRRHEITSLLGLFEYCIN